MRTHVLHRLVQLLKTNRDGAASMNCMYCFAKLLPCYLFVIVRKDWFSWKGLQNNYFLIPQREDVLLWSRLNLELPLQKLPGWNKNRCKTWAIYCTQYFHATKKFNYLKNISVLPLKFLMTSFFVGDDLLLEFSPPIFSLVAPFGAKVIPLLFFDWVKPFFPESGGADSHSIAGVFLNYVNNQITIFSLFLAMRWVLFKIATKIGQKGVSLQ